jgi:KDO2-lipid IV(A) lauroyltransferase
LTGHFGNFELMGAWLARLHPVDFVVRPLRNRPLDRWLVEQRRASGVGIIDANAGIRAVYRALAGNRWVPMVGDQDARRHGVFVPFFGRLASTPSGPARIALATGAPIVTGYVVRGADGRHSLTLDAPLEAGDPASADAVGRLTALHTARLEAWVRRHPAAWLWLHRRWKTSPPAAPPEAAAQRAAPVAIASAEAGGGRR